MAQDRNCWIVSVIKNIYSNWSSQALSGIQVRQSCHSPIRILAKDEQYSFVHDLSTSVHSEFSFVRY